MRILVAIGLLGLAGLTLGLLTFNADAATFYVEVDSTNATPPYSSWGTAAPDIQDAVDAASAGDTVLVTDGVYQVGGETIDGSLLTNRVVIDKPITVESVNGPARTIIEGNQLPVPEIFSGVPGTSYPNPLTPDGTNAVRCVCITTNAVLIGFTLTNGATLTKSQNTNDENGGGVWCAFTNGIEVSNCVIVANSAWILGGGAFQGTLADCTLLGNSSLDGGGIASASVFNSLVVSNIATDTTYGGGGAYNCNVFNSAIWENYADGLGGGAEGGSVVNCTITENTALVFGGGTADCAQTNSIIYYNKIFTGDTSCTNCFEGSFSYCCTPSDRGGQNISSDPALADPSHISLNSLCRGAGDPDMANGVDLDGHPWNNPPSIGCSEIPSGGDYGSLSVGIAVPLANSAPGFALSFQTANSGPDYQTVWNFGDGTIVTNEPYISHIWSAPGTYPVTLTAYNDSYPTGVTAAALINVAAPTNYYVNWANRSPTPPYLSWGTAATNIQDAVSVALPGSTIWVTNPTVGVWLGGQTIVTDSVAIYKYGESTAEGYYNPYRVGITNPVTVESVNGPATTYIEGDSIGNIGCVYMTNGAVLCGFTMTNGAAQNGGGILASSTNAVITNCVIEDCKAGGPGGGGGVYSGTLYNCSLFGNSGPDGGAANESILNNCLISNNAASYGGGTFLGVLRNCALICNSAANGGGGAAGGVLNDCLVVSNSSFFGGGAFGGTILGGGLTVPIALTDCLICSNTAEGEGGGVCNPSGAGSIPNPTNCILTDCLLTHNSARNGGGSYAAELSNCIISNNAANSVGGGVEGGLLNYCTLVANSASKGGGGGGNGLIDATLNNCSLIANTAVSGAGGGACSCILNKCSLMLNTNSSSFGGGAAAADSTLTGSLIVSNIAFEPTSLSPYYDGGAVCFCSLTNCLLAWNISPTNGGGAFQSTLVNCTIVANTSTIGGGSFDSTNDNCILYDNNGGDYYPDSSQYPLNDCCTPVPAANGIRNITNAPLFVDLAGGDFHLQADSPCINSGENAYIAGTPADLDGNPRIQGGTVDIGAYEYQSPTSTISYAFLQQYGLPINGSVDHSDLDGTGFTVYQDWIAGLDPTNAASVLAMLSPAVTNNAAGVTVSWRSTGGIPYLLQRSTNLSAQPFATIQDVTGQDGMTSYTDTSATNNVPYFYRVGVTR